MSMKNPNKRISAIVSVRNTLSQSALRRGFLLLALGLGCALSPTARAVSPPPDGGYANSNTAEGEDALLDLTSGINNTAIGFEALYSNTTGGDNTANGAFALLANTTGGTNTAEGAYALRYNTSGLRNTANGYAALLSNTTGNNNTASGFDALFYNKTGAFNTADGTDALRNNTTGTSNTANGVNALFYNKAGGQNTANGRGALYNNTTAFNNTADGYQALLHNSTGGSNTAVGMSALYNNTVGANNIALGVSAGLALTTGSNNIDLGNSGVAGENGNIRLGTKGTHTKAFIAGISGVTVAGGVGVIVDTDGHLGTISSSQRYKDAIQPMDKASEAILSLQPVTFRYKKELDPEGIPQFGLVAEQVEKVDPDLVARDGQGNAMLLNEFLKEHRKVEQQAQINQEQTATITDLKSALAQQQKDIAALTAAGLKAQAAQIQKVSDQLGAPAPAPRVVAND
jgi:hypothetical protein